MHDHEEHSDHESSCCGSCDHGHAESPLPANVLVSISGALLAAGLMIQWLKMEPSWLPTAAFGLSALSGGLLVFPSAFKALTKLSLDMNVLMTVAVMGAWLIGDHAEAASVVFLFALSELLESWSVGRARRAIQSLLKLAPETANLKQANGHSAEVPVAEVKVGDRILVRNGERVPLDGRIVSGESSINQAPITGESVPVEKKAGDTVFAGTINGEGSLEVEVTKVAGDSTLARIIKLVDDAEQQKAPTQRFVDKFARIYTPAVFIAAIVVAVLPPLLLGQPWSVWSYRALVLLVIACPCALVIATPVSIVSGLTTLARRGVLIKSGAFLETVAKLRALAVDKTGTITQGKPRVTGIVAMSGWSESDVLAKAAAIEMHSSHPLAKAIVAEAQARGIALGSAEGYQSRTGLGAEASLDGHPHFIGNHKMAHQLGVCSPEIERQLAAVEARGESVAVLGHLPHDQCPGEVLGILAIGDTMRPEVPEALKRLHAVGIEKIVMLSGDNQHTVDAIAAQAGIDEAVGGLLPEDKVARVRALVQRFGYVGMIGDGVNDAPALAIASVGIAMGAAGSDTAIETAGMALMNDDLTKLAEAIAVGKRTLSIIHFNVGFALALKAVFLILAFTGYSSLWLAILADTGATLLVIANALRLLRSPH